MTNVFVKMYAGTQELSDRLEMLENQYVIHDDDRGAIAVLRHVWSLIEDGYAVIDIKSKINRARGYHVEAIEAGHDVEYHKGSIKQIDEIINLLRKEVR